MGVGAPVAERPRDQVVYAVALFLGRDVGDEVEVELRVPRPRIAIDDVASLNPELPVLKEGQPIHHRHGANEAGLGGVTNDAEVGGGRCFGDVVLQSDGPIGGKSHVER